ncbi:hypothetical protein ACTXT7_009255 [Hymenolepis weldensis]
MLPVYLLLVIECFVVTHANRISLHGLPSLHPQNGSKLQLICQLQEKGRFNIMWKRDDRNVGENCIYFKNINGTVQDCFHNETITEWIIDPVTYDTRGLWSCIHGKDMASVNITVNVPQNLNPLKIELLPQNSNQSASGTFLNSISAEEFSLGTGTRSNPINLIESRAFGVKNFVFECSSVCASETRQLVWTSLNSTMFRKYPSFRTSHKERGSCPGALTSTKSRALVTCAVGYQKPNRLEPEPPVSVDLKLALVGLNIVYCSTDQSARISNVGSYSCINGFLNDSSNTACAYVLCYGILCANGKQLRKGRYQAYCNLQLPELASKQALVSIGVQLFAGPPPPVLTSGEQTAIVIATFLMIFVIVAVCIFTWRSRKSDKATRMSQYNSTLPQSHHTQEAQMELML